MKPEIRIGNLSAEQNSKAQGYYEVLDTGLKLPVTIINGKADGKTLLITAGVHGCEYLGIQAAIEIADEIDPCELNGNIIIVSIINQPSFFDITPFIILEDGKNLNRVFPGRNDGTISEKIAFVISNEFQSKADFYIDLHCGDINEMVTPFAYYPGLAEESVVNASRSMGLKLGLRFITKSGSKGGAYHAAAERGIPSLLIERGGLGSWDKSEVNAYKEDMYSVLHHLDILKNSDFDVYDELPEVTGAIYLTSDYSGCWYPEVNAGDFVMRGKRLGEIRDFFGNVLKVYEATIDGVILYMTVSLPIKKNSPLIAYGTL